MFTQQLHPKFEKVLKISLLCFVWYTVSSLMGIVGKMILNDFPFPLTLTMVHMALLCLFLVPYIKCFTKGTVFMPSNYTRSPWFKSVLLLALGKFFSSAFTHISILKMPVSYAHTVKATLPLFTVILTKAILKEHQTFQIYVSLIPIVLGVLISSLTEISFNFLGLISALISTIIIALQNIYSKKALKDRNLPPLTFLLALAFLATLFFFPFWIYWDLEAILHFKLQTKKERLIILFLVDGLCYFMQNVAAFQVMAMISSLSYSVVNCTKRIAIISASILVLANPVNFLNVVGMLIATFGVLLYQKTKLDQYSKLESALPCHLQNDVVHQEMNKVNQYADDSFQDVSSLSPSNVIITNFDSLVMRSHDYKAKIEI